MSTEGRFVWYELLTPDVEAAKGFYTMVVGWGLEDWGGGNHAYTMWKAGGTPMGGVMELPAELRERGVSPHWMGHVRVADLDGAVARVAELGGKVHKAPTDIPTIGRFSIVADPQGAVLSLFEPEGEGMAAPDRSAPGFVRWHELYTPDVGGAWSFYREMFGWEHTETMELGDMGSYLMFRHPEDGEADAMGGMFDPRQDEIPPAWGFYVTVEGLDAAAERVTAGGGRIINGPMEVPGGGRIVQATDPQGGYFALFSMT